MLAYTKRHNVRFRFLQKVITLTKEKRDSSKSTIWYTRLNHLICHFGTNMAIWNHKQKLPEGLEKSNMLVVGCRRSGLLDESVPGIGIIARLCLQCLVPTMLSSCDWLRPPSLQNNGTKSIWEFLMVNVSFTLRHNNTNSKWWLKNYILFIAI